MDHSRYIQRTYGHSKYHSTAGTQQCGCGGDKGLLCSSQGAVRIIKIVIYVRGTKMFKLKRCIAVIVLYAIMMSVVGQDAQASTNFTTICKSTTVDNKNNDNFGLFMGNGG